MILDRFRLPLSSSIIATAGALLVGGLAAATSPPGVQPGTRPDARPATPPIEAPGIVPGVHEGAPADAKPKGDHPSVEEIHANFVKAVGGEERLRAIKSRKTTGRFEMSQMPGMAMSMVMYAKSPNVMLLTLEIPGMGEIKQGYDGTVGWSMDPMQGPMLLPDEVLESTRRQSRFHQELDMLKDVKKAEVVRQTEFAGKQTWEVRLTPEEGEPTTLFFGVDDHLLWGMTMTAASPMGTMESRTVIKEYREFDGVKVASRTEIDTMGMTQTMTVDRVETNAVDDAVFALPAPIQALVDAKREREKAKDGDATATPSGS